MLEVFFSIFIFSFVPVAIKFCNLNAYTICFSRLLIASFLVFIFWNKKINLKNIFTGTSYKLLLIGVLFFFHWLTYATSIKLSSASLCVLGMSTYGVQLIFYGALFLGYHVTKKNILSLIGILFGVILVIPNFNFQNKETLGFFLGLLSAGFYALIPIVLQKSHEFTNELRIFSQFFVAMIGFSFFYSSLDFSMSKSDFAALIFLAVFGTFIAHSLWSRVTAKLPTTKTGIYYYVITPSAMILSHFILGEKLSLFQLFGAILILGSAFYNSRTELTGIKK